MPQGLKKGISKTCRKVEVSYDFIKSLDKSYMLQLLIL